MKQKTGVSASEGVVISEAYIYRHASCDAKHTRIEKAYAYAELERFYHALSALIESNKAILCSTNEEKSLINLSIELLSDPQYKKDIETLIEKKLYNASWAVEETSDKYIDALRSNPNPLFQEREADLLGVKQKLIAELEEKRMSVQLSSRAVLVADYLLPSELLSLDRSLLDGIALERGGRTSHIAILSRSLNIPAVLALENITQYVENSDPVILDATTGLVIIKPEKEIVQYYQSIRKAEQRKENELVRKSGLPAVTKDGHRIKLLCNINSPDELEDVKRSGAEGIGLFRTEFLFLQKELFTNEDRKAEIYDSVALSMLGVGPVVVRTIDVGGDKYTSDFGTLESNSFLGNRSIRYCMDHKEIFRNQLISILKASVHGNIAIMFPFISSVKELDEVLRFFKSVKADCRKRGILFDENIKVGTMIEVPSAAIMSDLIADRVDFMSIGTNDLIQYTIAVDRGNDKVSALYNPLSPAVLRLLKLVADNARAKSKPVSVCGEMAGISEYTPLLIGLGFETLSMTGQSVLNLRTEIRSLSYTECKALTDRILSMSDEKEIEKELREFNGKTGDT